MRLFIATPSCRDHSPHFVASLVGMVKHLAGNGVEGRTLEEFDVNIRPQSSNLPQARQIMLDDAVRRGFTHLLFLDDDMTFPFDMLDALANRGVPVVGANCCRKTLNGLYYTAAGEDRRPVPSKGRTGIQEVAKVGTGVMLIELAALVHVPRPHFEIQWREDAGCYRAEDVYFCEKLREHGVPIHIDHDVSHHVGHMGTFEHRFSAYTTAEEVAEEQGKKAAGGAGAA